MVLRYRFELQIEVNIRLQPPKFAKLNKIEEIIQSCSVIFEAPVEKNEMILPGIFINKGTTDSTVPVAAKLQCWTFFLYSQGSW